MSQANWYALATLAAIALGPVIAVLLTRLIDKRAEARDRKFQVFKSLMQTRGIRLDPAHVAALNVVEVEFYSYQSVRKSYGSYIDHLNRPLPAVEEQEHFFDQRADLFIDLLYEIGIVVGYRFDKRELEKRGYAPIGWDNDQNLQRRNAFLINQLLSGERPLPITNVFAGKNPFPEPPKDD